MIGESPLLICGEQRPMSMCPTAVAHERPIAASNDPAFRKIAELFVNLSQLLLSGSFGQACDEKPFFDEIIYLLDGELAACFSCRPLPATSMRIRAHTASGM